VQNADRWIPSEEPVESFMLLASECSGAFSEGGKVATLLFDFGSDLAEQLHEVMLHEAHDMEAICHDSGIGEVAFDQGTVRNSSRVVA